jgi:hypothetical protein
MLCGAVVLLGIALTIAGVDAVLGRRAAVEPFPARHEVQNGP